jgi:hypothetical protein
MEKEEQAIKELENYKYGTADKEVDEWRKSFTSFMNLEMDLMFGIKERTMTSKWKLINFLSTSCVYWMIDEAEKAGIVGNKRQAPKQISISEKERLDAIADQIIKEAMQELKGNKAPKNKR